MHESLNIEIVEFTDPVCTWCWGSEPILRKLEYRYSKKVKISYVMGGLVRHVNELRDVANGIGGNIDTVNEEIAKHWLIASSKHKMPVSTKNFKLLTNEHPSTYPMNIAYKAAQFQSEEVANKFLRKMREAVSVEGRMVNHFDALIELSKEVGVDVEKFIEDINSGKAEKAFQQDLKFGSECKVHGFPSYIVKCSNGKQILIRGFNSYESFKNVITEISGGELKENVVTASKESIKEFIKKFEKVTTSEIMIAFDIEPNELDKYLTEIKKDDERAISILPAGNGFFVTYNK